MNLLRTTTLAAYHDGEEHYVTAFQFAGGGGEFGSLVPLPGVPTSVEKGGDWTLQRLVRETDPPVLRSAALRRRGCRPRLEPQELMKVSIDALGHHRPAWRVQRRRASGQPITASACRPTLPRCSTSTPHRSPIFLAAVFDADAARDRGQAVGDGTPVHITIPTDNPWVPLRILALGKTGTEQVDADVYLMTDHAPRLLPFPTTENGLALQHFAPATDLAAFRPAIRQGHGMGAGQRLADQDRASTPRPPISSSTWRSTPAEPANRRRSAPGCPSRRRPTAADLGTIAGWIALVLSVTAGLLLMALIVGRRQFAEPNAA